MSRIFQRNRVYLFAGLIAVIAAAAFYSFRLRPVVADVQITPPSARDVSRGHDTLVQVTVEVRGRHPEWISDAVLKQADLGEAAQLLVEGDGRSETRPVEQLRYAWWNQSQQRFILNYRLKLADLPAGKVRLRDRVALFHSQTTQLSENTSHTGEPEQKTAPLHLDILVRESGTTSPPKVSRDAGVAVLSVQTRPALAGEKHRDEPVDAVAQLLLVGGGRMRSSIWDVRRFEVVDGAGKKVDASCVAHFESLDISSDREPLKITVQWPRVPRERGALFIKGRIGLNENWPLLVTIPIRDRAGRAVTLAPSPPAKATGVEIGPAPLLAT